MKATYTEADDINIIAEKVKKNSNYLSHINLNNIRFLRTTKNFKGDEVLGKCIFLNDRVQFLTRVNYIIEFPPIFDTLSDTQKEIVVEHELLHIPANNDGIQQHDIGEFNVIIDKHGLDWLKTIKYTKEKSKLMKEKLTTENKLKKLKKEKNIVATEDEKFLEEYVIDDGEK